MIMQPDLNLGKHVERAKDIFLCHNGANKPWVEALAEQLETVRHNNRYLGVAFEKWDFDKGKNIVLELEKYIDEARFVGVVVSKAMLEAEWPTLERTIAVWSDPSGRKGRVVTLLLANVELPASFRVRNWIDFRDPSKYEEGFLDISTIGFLLPHIAGTNLRHVSDTYLVTQLLQQLHEPMIVSYSFNAHDRRRSQLAEKPSASPLECISLCSSVTSVSVSSMAIC